jgi:hypothetical protein
MTWQQIGALGELLSAIGVIASVLYLAFQVKGEREATLANTRQLRQNGVRDTALTMASSELLTPIVAKVGQPGPVIIALMDAFDLDREEAHRLNGFNIAMLRQLETNLRMDMEPEEREATLETIRVQMNGQMGVWWPAAKPLFSRSFIEQVDQMMGGDT